jgi:hypothetical protein
VIAWGVEEIQIVQIGLAEGGLLQSKPQTKSLALDFRPANLPSNTPVKYILSEDHWKSPADPEILSRVALLKRTIQPHPTKNLGRSSFRVLLIVMIIAPILFIFARKKLKQQKHNHQP